MNSYIVSVNLRSTWVLANSKNGVSDAMERVKKAVAGKEGIEVVFLYNDFNRAKFLIFSNQSVSEQDVKQVCLDTIKELDTDEINVKINPLEKDELKNVVSDCHVELNENIKNLLKEHFDIDTVAMHAVSGYSDKVSSIDELICFEPLKDWVTEVSKMAAKFGSRLKDTGLFNKLTYLIGINRGNGRSTILKTMLALYKEYGFIEGKGDIDVCEKVFRYTGSDSRDMLQSPYLESVIETLNKGFTGIMALDMSEWMGHLDDRRIDILLDIANSVSSRVTFVFFVPYVEQSVFEKVRIRIDDVISTRTMQFVPPSDEQYFVFFKRLLTKCGIAVEDEAYPQFAQKITEERNDGRFYSFNTVEKMANELLYGIIYEAAKNDTEIPARVGIKEMCAIYNEVTDDGISGLEQLDGMVALREVKDKVREILATLKLQKRMFSDGAEDYKPCYHMMFTGNPGTGKTVVARIIGKIFKEEGLLPIGNFYEVSRGDFVGQYVGHTAPKTMEICRNAYGSVLFIDEAYLLADDHDSFSKEAVGTLIAEMENNRDKMVVIFAGYEKELEELFDMNSGLRDRVPHIINFPNYTRDELKEIFYLQLGDKMAYDESFKAAVDKYFSEIPDSQINDRYFSNGRFVRNLVERIISKAALRFDMQKEMVNEYILTASDLTLSVEPFNSGSASGKARNIRRLGF